MKLSLLLALILVLNILQNVADGKKSKKTKKPPPYKIPPYPIRPKPVMYYTHQEISHHIIHNIDETLKYLSQTTCLNFKKQNNSVKRIGINFYLQNFSKVELSTKKYKPTNVYLKDSIINDTRDLYFYMGLALGLVPEITRNDSIHYLEVLEENLSKTNFEKYYKVKKYGNKILASTSFDYYSMMLSSPFFKSENEDLTYIFKSYLSKYFIESVFTTEDFSYSDIKRLWYLHCSNKYRKKKKCKHGGFYLEHLKKCECPLPFTGKECEKLFKNEESCGKTQEFLADSSQRNHTIKNIQSSCTYSIKSKKGKKVRFKIFNLNFTQRHLCNIGFKLEVKYRKDKSATGLGLCDNYNDISFPPLSSEIYLVFNDEGSNRLEFSYNEVEENEIKQYADI
uniref:Astacin domain-containing protein n=1 Tax=Strongyloides papillosus TaxID=174720 RepID=A0A0N5CBA9_STREA